MHREFRFFRSWDPRWSWVGAGVLLFILHLALAKLSAQFDYERDLLVKPILTFVGIEMLAAVVYLLVVASLGAVSLSKSMLIWVLAVGVVLRAVLFASTPVLEDDFYRYLWDGAVTAEGASPYAFSPGEVLTADEASPVPVKLRQLSANSGEIIWRINHPGLRTIYPPVAQATFALAYWIKPWSLMAWRLLLLGFDVATLGLLVLLLQRLRLPLLGLVIYWWNPLLVKEVFNSGHMDVVALPLVLGALLLATSGRQVLSAGALGLAVGAKIWPALLLPVLLRSLINQPRRLAVALTLFALLSGAMFFPVWRGGLDAGSGLTAYGQRWEMNDALYMLLHWLVQSLVKIAGSGVDQSQFIARLLTGLLLAGVVIWVIRPGIDEGVELVRKCLVIIAALFLLSPTQFPWYFVWFLPFLVLCRRWSLLLLTLLLPLYYLRYYFLARNQVEFFDQGIVWLEHVPVWLMLAREWYLKRRGQLQACMEVAV